MSTVTTPSVPATRLETNLRRALRPRTPDLWASARLELSARARAARTIGLVLLAAAALALPDLMTWAGPDFAICFGLVIAMVVLSITVMGWIGEISLAPVAQMGFGVVTVDVCYGHDIPFAVSFLIVVAASIPISLVLASFTLRMKGVSFSIATLAFAYMAHKSFFLSRLGTYGAFGGTGTDPVTRPEFIRTDHAFYYFGLAVLLALAAVCWAIQRSRVGARLTALRESEMALSTLGHPPAAYRFFTICLSGAIAAIAGACFLYLQLQVPSNLLLPGKAVLYFGFAVAGGLGSVGGAILAGLVFGAAPKYLETLTKSGFNDYDLFVTAVIMFVVMMRLPGGLAEVGSRLWRRVEGSRA